jgi:excisionase family DNA binding protein
MAGKLITQEEAAQVLGVSPADVNEMRQRQELFGVRDGGAWKFKQEDVERVLSERGAGGGSDISASSSGLDLPVDLDLDMSGPGSQIVLSEFELGDSGPGSSTVIGAAKKPDADLEPSGLNLLDSGTLKPEPKKPGPKPSSDEESVFGTGSGLDLMASDVRLADAGNSNVLSGLSNLGGPGASAAGRTMLTAELANADKPLDSSVKMTLRDQESVFGDPGSDVTRNIGGSGINLLDPKDSGMQLEELDLSGASGISRLGGDELKGDDDFLLTPLSEQTDDSSDSGSQVIALDGDFGDDATATLLAGDVPGLADALSSGGFGGARGNAAYVGGGISMVPEAKFGVGSVIALGLCAIVMAFTGVMMYDVVRNMWSWKEPLSVDSTLMDMILGRK